MKKSAKKAVAFCAGILILMILVILLRCYLGMPECPYDAAVRNGYTGSREQWIAALVGEYAEEPDKSAYDCAWEYGYTESYETWMRDLTGKPCREQDVLPYYVALDAGYSGTLEEWLGSTVPNPETMGLSDTEETQYEQALIYGFEGTFIQWLISLVL